MKNLLAIFMAGILVVSCNNSDDDEQLNPVEPDVPVVSCNIIEVNNAITSPTTWEDGFVYLIDGFDLSIRSVLTIQPGAIVKIRNARISIFEEGKIMAIGNAEKRIVFTSFADDRYCGDTNGDGAATAPEKGDWIMLDLHGTIGSVFKYVDIFYAGQPQGGYSRAVHIDWSQSVNFTFDHCRIAHTYYMPGSNYAFYGTSHMIDANVSKFTNNALYDNGRPIYFNTFYALDPSNVFHNPENPEIKNSNNGIYLSIWSSEGNQGQSVTWNNTEVPYVSNSPSVTQVHSSATINIAAGVVVKFINTSGGIQSYNGSVQLDSAAILTSYKDDSIGGDTNGDGNITTPATGDWEGFRSTNGGASWTWITGDNIRYAAN
ncbi:MAG: hypothetical protein Q4G27_05910 [Flavobacteriaceae bacterium]|nr:hypothetical protein [Flavobacteriaceae bacterium]